MTQAILSVVVGCTVLLACSPHSEVTANDPLPTTILTCGGSVITQINPRLEGDTELSTGFSVWFKNGGATMDYETPQAVRDAKVGDQVLICLIHIPDHCPPGDHRGRMYTVTNLRTLLSWSASDSQHSCGGA